MTKEINVEKEWELAYEDLGRARTQGKSVYILIDDEHGVHEIGLDVNKEMQAAFICSAIKSLSERCSKEKVVDMLHYMIKHLNQNDK